MTVLEIIQRSTEFLARKGVDSPRLQIELLLAHVLQVPRLKLYLDFNRALSSSQVEMLRGLVQRRAAREPLQHIMGSTSFCGLEIRVTPAVLVPRPETELLAERAWQFLNERASGSEMRVLDFGTGSGCLAVSIATKVPFAELHAIDISEAALKIARENAERLQVSDRVHFHAGDGFAALPPKMEFDLLVSNPPYIPSGEIAELQPEVREHDPRLALDGGVDGLDFYRRLAVEGARFLAKDGQLMVEFGDGQEPALLQIFVEPNWTIKSVEEDYSKRPRILIAKRRD